MMQLEGKSADRFDARRLWTTSSEACCSCRRACQPTQNCQSGYAYASPTGYYSSAREATARQAAVLWRRNTGGTAGYPGGYSQPGTTSAGPATTRAASAGRRPGWGCGPVWRGGFGPGRRPPTCSPITLRGVWLRKVYKVSGTDNDKRFLAPLLLLAPLSLAYQFRAGRSPQ